jgi:hypothetical protein
LPLPLTTLNTYFASVGKSLAAKFTTVSQTFTASPTPVPETMFELEEVQESYVLAQLQTLTITKAIGLDKISARLLKCAPCSISKSVTRLLNLRYPKPYRFELLKGSAKQVSDRRRHRKQDAVNHSILLHKRKAMGVSSSNVGWFESYLS